jgi:hypothetical protein
MHLYGAVPKSNNYHDKKNPRHVQNVYLGLTVKNVMKYFAVTALVFLNTSHSTARLQNLD